MKTNVIRKNKGRRGKRAPVAETPLEEFSRKLTQLSKIQPAPSTGPKLFKEGPGGTLEQVGREADNAWAGVKKIMSLLNVESKVLDYQVQFTSTYGGNALNLSAIAQGVGDNQRTGDSLRVQRLRVRFWVNYATAATPVTLVIGRSKDSLPAVGDIFEVTSNGYSSMAFENHDQRKADVTLMRRVVVSDSVSHPVQYVEFEMKCPDVPTTYSNGTTTATANTYWAAVICGVASGASITMNSRLWFVDN
jgi:hypothetical protein